MTFLTSAYITRQQNLSYQSYMRIIILIVNDLIVIQVDLCPITIKLPQPFLLSEERIRRSVVKSACSSSAMTNRIEIAAWR